MFLSMKNTRSSGVPIDPRVRIGHVHLKVADLQRALDFYCGVLGFEVMERHGNQVAFVAAGGYHHHICFTTSPFSTQAGSNSPTHCEDYWPPRFRSMAPAIMA